MSEQNILNPSASSLLCPDFPIQEVEAETILRWQARSGTHHAKRFASRGPVFQLQWNDRPFSVYQQLRQWANQYEQDFFTLYDIDLQRYYSGMFANGVQYKRKLNNQVDITAVFVVVPNLPVFQYPSAWGVDSVFREERDGFGSDLVKLTSGTWDRRDQNYALWSDDLSNAVWPNFGVTATGNAIADPDGNLTATRLVGTNALDCNVSQQNLNAVVPGCQVTFSIYLKVPSGTFANFPLRLNDQAGGGNVATTLNTLTTSWQLFSVTANYVGGQKLIAYLGAGSSWTAGQEVHACRAQIEFAGSRSTYTKTTSSPVNLISPTSSAFCHNGFSYFTFGNLGTELIEWLYLGYGFRLWSQTGPDMGKLNVFVDGVNTTQIDLYSASRVASAPVYTNANLPLGEHRIGLGAAGTKNASSTGFIVCADALEVMR